MRRNTILSPLLTVVFFVPAASHPCAAEESLPPLDEETIFVDQPTPIDEPVAGARLREATDAVHADDARSRHGVDGHGFAAAIVDTGVAEDHRDLTGRILEGGNFSRDGRPSTATNDVRGHGTHVAGIVAASGDIHLGIAPAASIVPIKVFSDVPDSGASNRAILEGLQWVAENSRRLRITAVNMSLGSGNYSSFPAQASDFQDVLNRLRDQRIVVICATGNSYGYFRQQGMAFPAICPNVISVGAVYDDDVGRMAYERAVAHTTARRRYAPFSQRLHASFGDHAGTTIFAPGAVITSSGLRAPHFAADLQGTSMATPIVTGVVVLMQQAYARTRNELPTVEQVANALQQSALLEIDGDDEDDNVPNTNQSFAQINADAAIEQLLSP